MSTIVDKQTNMILKNELKDLILFIQNQIELDDITELLERIQSIVDIKISDVSNENFRLINLLQSIKMFLIPNQGAFIFIDSNNKNLSNTKLIELLKIVEEKYNKLKIS